MRVPLDETITITLNGAGGGTARLGPLTARETWYPQQASVRANANPTNEAQCFIYVGTEATADNFKDLTFTGSSGDATDKISGRMPKGRYVFATWSGGDAGAQAYLTVTGDPDSGGGKEI